MGSGPSLLRSLGIFAVFISSFCLVRAQTTSLQYSTYLDGSSEDQAQAVAVDSTGASVVAGFTISSDFPTTPGAIQAHLSGQMDAFVSKLKPDGSGLIASTYFGTGNEQANAVALDGQGNVYVAGVTNCWQSATPLPATSGAIQSRCAGLSDGFVLKLDPTLSHILYLTYLGGSNNDQVNSIAVDSAGDAYVLGTTSSADFPTTSGVFQPTNGGGQDAFVAKINPQGTALLYSSFLGGSSLDDGSSIRVDSAGNAYLAGDTSSANFPVTAHAYQQSSLYLCPDRTCNGYVTKISPDASKIIWSTYFSFPTQSFFFNIALDSADDVAIAGKTEGGVPATAGAYSKEGGAGDAFVGELKSDGSGLLFLGYFGGSQWDGAQGIAVDAADHIWIGGRSSSPDLPVTAGAWNSTCTPYPNVSGCNHAFIAEFSGDGSQLLYSSDLDATGSSYGSGAWAIGVNPAGTAVIAGYAFQGLAVSPNAFQSTYQGVNSHVFVAEFASETPNCSNCAAITATPAQLSFPDTDVSQSSAAQTVTIANSATDPIAVQSITVPAGFTYTSQCAATLNKGDSCTIAVTFTPAAAQAYTGNLTVTPTSGNPVTVALSGNGVTSSSGGGGGGGSGGGGSGGSGSGGSSGSFALLGPSAPVTASAMGSASVQISVVPSNGFTGTVSLSCQGLAAGTTCSFTPAAVNFTGASTPAQVSLQVQIPVATSSTAVFPIALLPPFFFVRRRRRKKLLTFLAGAASLLVIGCGVSVVPPNRQPTPAPTQYHITVVANGGGQQQSLSLVIQGH